MKTKQICENFRDQYVTLNGIRLSLEELCSGVFITGNVGSGKTVTWANRLTKEIASLHAEKPDEKASIIYFNLKGGGANQLLEELPKARRDDVIHLTSGKDCPHSLALFELFRWNSHNECRGALVNWIEEVMTQVLDSADSRDHDRQFWASQRLHILNTLASLDVALPGNDPNFFNALHALIYRLDQFLSFVNEMRFSKSEHHKLAEKFGKAGFNEYDLDQLKEWIFKHQASKNEKRPSVLFEQFMHWSKILLEELDAPVGTIKKIHPFDAFWKTLTHESKKKAEALFLQYRHLAETTWTCVSADLQGIVSFFQQEPLATLLSPVKKGIPLERIFEEGKIMVIDCPIADSGGFSRGALVAIKVALMNRLLGRYQFSNQVRPVVLVADEYQSIVGVSRGNGGDDAFLARSREYGVVNILATQSLSLLKGVLRSEDKVLGLISNLKTKIFSANEDIATLELGSLCLGLKKAILAGIPWQKSDQILRALQSSNNNLTPLVSPPEFANLQPGEAYVCTPSAAYHVNANSSHPKPIVEILRDTMCHEKKSVLS